MALSGGMRTILTASCWPVRGGHSATIVRGIACAPEFKNKQPTLMAGIRAFRGGSGAKNRMSATTQARIPAVRGGDHPILGPGRSDRA
jgi:hypothetical protein